MTTTQSEWWGNARKALAAEEDLSVFKTWGAVRAIPLYDPLPRHFAGYADKIVKLMDANESARRWIAPLVDNESKQGHTEESWQEMQRSIVIDGQTIAVTPWIAQALYHVLMFENATGRWVTDYERIIEFGAGIGELQRLIRNVGFNGRYQIYDFPEVTRISKEYTIDAEFYDKFEDINQHVGDELVLFIATWSLSETPIEYRESIMPYIRGADQLIAFQTSVWGYDNLSYFVWEYPRATNTFVQLELQMPGHSYDQGQDVYLFGKATN